MKKRRKVENKIRDITKRWGYEEINTPTFEALDLFKLKSGEEIVEEIYEFKDKSDRELALRPEITASVMRFYSNELKAKPKPLKLFYFGNCFRYEQPQRGRYREFWQFGTEVIGGKQEYVEAEIIALADSVIDSLNLSYELKIGNIGILRSLMNYYDLKIAKQNVVLSKIDKFEDNLREALKKENIPDDLIKKLIDLNETNQPLKEVKEYFDDINKSKEKIEAFEKTLNYLKDFGITNFSLDLSVTRGLDYYMGTVFEVFAEGLGSQNQICGGGTYKFPELIQEDVASTGFGLGFDRIIAAIKTQKDGIKFSPRSWIYVAPLSDEFRGKALSVTKKLRNHFSVEVDLKGRGIGDQLSYANRIGIPYVILLGEEEIKQEKVALKDMKSGKQNKYELDEVIKKIKEF